MKQFWLLSILSGFGLAVLTNTGKEKILPNDAGDSNLMHTKADTCKYELEGHIVVLSQLEKNGRGLYDPIFKERKIVIDNQTIIDVDAFQNQSETLSENWNFPMNAIKLKSKTDKLLVFEVLLSYPGCSGSFCSDFVVITVNMDLHRNRTTYTITDEYRGVS